MREPTRKRRASELYIKGMPLRLDDGETELVPQLDDAGQPTYHPILGPDEMPVVDAEGNPTPDLDNPVMVEEPLPPVMLWVTKLNDLEQTTAMRHATKAQAVVMAARKNHESLEWQSMHETLAVLDREEWLATLVNFTMADRRDLIEARMIGETVTDMETGEEQPNEWAKDGYLQGLKDAWLEGLNARYAEDPEDPEAAQVYAEMERFDAEVQAEFDHERDIELQMLIGLSDDFLLEKITDQMTEADGKEAWAEEYKLWVVALCARDCEGPDPDHPGKCLCRGSNRKHTELHFKDGIEEVRAMDGSLRSLIYAVYNTVTVDVRQGKSLRANRASSQPSGSPDTEATSDSSGPATVTA